MTLLLSSLALAAIATAATACGKDAAPAHTCDGYGKTMLAAVGGGDDFKAVVAAAVESCKADGWSQQAIDCYLTPQADGDPATCDAMLTEAQRKGRDRRTTAALMAATK